MYKSFIKTCAAYLFLDYYQERVPRQVDTSAINYLKSRIMEVKLMMNYLAIQGDFVEDATQATWVDYLFSTSPDPLGFLLTSAQCREDIMEEMTAIHQRLQVQAQTQDVPDTFANAGMPQSPANKTSDLKDPRLNRPRDH